MYLTIRYSSILLSTMDALGPISPQAIVLSELHSLCIDSRKRGMYVADSSLVSHYCHGDTKRAWELLGRQGCTPGDISFSSLDYVYISELKSSVLIDRNSKLLHSNLFQNEYTGGSTLQIIREYIKSCIIHTNYERSNYKLPCNEITLDIHMRPSFYIDWEKCFSKYLQEARRIYTRYTSINCLY